MNDSFIFYPSFYEALEGLPDDSYIRLSKCIISFGITGQASELRGFEKNIFAAVKPQIEAGKAEKEASNGI